MKSVCIIMDSNLQISCKYHRTVTSKNKKIINYYNKTFNYIILSMPSIAKYNS